MQVINLSKPISERVYFGRSWFDDAKNQCFENRYFPVFCAEVGGLTPGSLLDVWFQAHFATDTYNTTSSALGVQLRLAGVPCLQEAPFMKGSPISCYPVSNMKPRMFTEHDGKAHLNPIGVYLTVQRAAKRLIPAAFPSSIFVVAWAFARSFGAKETDFITVGGGIKDPGSGDYSQMDVAVIDA